MEWAGDLQVFVEGTIGMVENFRYIQSVLSLIILPLEGSADDPQSFKAQLCSLITVCVCLHAKSRQSCPTL